jgi:hypothetical protein
VTQRNIERMTADDLWQDWREDVERIKLDTHELFFIRRQFGEIASMFEGNSGLRATSGNIWMWLRTLYTSTVLMRVRREVDNQPNTMNLRTLIEEIQKRPDVVTRARIASRNPDLNPTIAAIFDDAFTKHWVGRSRSAGSPDDTIDPAIVARDRQALEALTDRLVEITSRTVAHRQRVPPQSVTVTDANEIFDLIEELLTKYLSLLTGAGLMSAEPTPQYDTFEPFMFPWHPQAYEEWLQLRRRQEEA